MTLTPRDEQIVRMLTNRLRLLGVGQVARKWWAGHAIETARARLRKLAGAGLIELTTVMAHPEIILSAPVLTWRPGNVDPDFGPIAYRLKRRWTQPRIATAIAHATRRSASMFGGHTGGRGPRPTETTHELHLAQVYLHLERDDPSSAERWVSERELYAEGWGRNERLPDAIIRHGGSESPPVRVIEFGGAYSKAKLQEFHLEMRDIPYDLW
jgi:hypothetical protein